MLMSLAAHSYMGLDHNRVQKTASYAQIRTCLAEWQAGWVFGFTSRQRKHVAELSVTTFGTFLPELSPPPFQALSHPTSRWGFRSDARNVEKAGFQIPLAWLFLRWLSCSGRLTKSSSWRLPDPG